MILGTKNPKASNKKYCKGLYKEIDYKMYDVILPVYLYK